jgi:hypothetical protein
MMKLFKRFEKQFVTIVMVLLMITFLAQVGSGRGASRRNDPTIGKANGQPIYQSELAESRAQWQALRQYVQVYDPTLRQEVPIAGSTDFLGPAAFRQISDQPELFMLLIHEARNAPLQVNSDDFQTILLNDYHRPANLDDPDAVDGVVHEAVANLLLIKQNFARMAGAIKISQPQRAQFLAQAFQQIKLNLIDLPAADFAAKVPAPDPAQVQKQFDLFANTPPGFPIPGSNPFGFGYRLPDRVKLQYVEIDRAEAEKAIDATKSAYDWDVAARLYWLQHASEFPATQPASAQLGPVSPPAPPATAARPYEQVKDQALAAVRDPLVDRLMLDVQGQVVSALTADSRTSPTTAPSDDSAYAVLHQLVESVQSQQHVKIFVTDLTHTFHGMADLSNSTIVGAIADATAGDVPFPQAAMQQAMTYLSPLDKTSPPPRSFLMQPSSLLTDVARNLYIFRLTDAKPAQPAPSVDEARSQIVADLRTAAGYALAKVAGNGLIAAARSRSLDQVAKSAGKPILTTDAFSLFQPDPGAAVLLQPAARLTFVQQGFRLLADYNPATRPHPLGLIELPQDQHLFVAQLQSLTPDWRGTHYAQDDVEVAQYLRSQISQQLKQQWMNYDAVVQRTRYVPTQRPTDASP